MSAIFSHQPPTRPQKSNSREGLFGCKKGAVVDADKMNTHCIKPQFAADFGLFAAKCESISINIHHNCIDKTIPNHKKHDPKGQNTH